MTLKNLSTRTIFIILVISIWGFIAAAEDSTDGRPSAEEMAAITGNDAPKTIEEQVQDVISDDSDAVTVTSVDGRTVLQMEGEPDDEFTLSFSSVRDGVMAHVQLGKGGLKHRFTLVKPEGNDTPIYLDLKGPAVNGGYGVKMTLRF